MEIYYFYHPKDPIIFVLAHPRNSALKRSLFIKGAKWTILFKKNFNRIAIWHLAEIIFRRKNSRGKRPLCKNSSVASIFHISVFCLRKSQVFLVECISYRKPNSIALSSIKNLQIFIVHRPPFYGITMAIQYLTSSRLIVWKCFQKL